MLIACKKIEFIVLFITLTYHTHARHAVNLNILALSAAIRVEFGERGLERMRGGEGGEVWCRQMFEM